MGESYRYRSYITHIMKRTLSKIIFFISSLLFSKTAKCLPIPKPDPNPGMILSNAESKALHPFRSRKLRPITNGLNSNIDFNKKQIYSKEDDIFKNVFDKSGFGNMEYVLNRQYLYPQHKLNLN